MDAREAGGLVKRGRILHVSVHSVLVLPDEEASEALERAAEACSGGDPEVIVLDTDAQTDGSVRATVSVSITNSPDQIAEFIRSLTC